MIPHTSDELTVLHAALDARRRHILEIVEHLDDDQLRAATLPSGWTPVELVRHLTLGDERYWFESIVGGADLDWIPTGPRADWTIPPDVPAQSVVEAYRQQIAVSDDVLTGVRPDDAPQRRDPAWGAWGVDFPTVRLIVVHMLVETATHAGHLDAAVELLDGRQHLVVDR